MERVIQQPRAIIIDDTDHKKLAASQSQAHETVICASM